MLDNIMKVIFGMAIMLICVVLFVVALDTSLKRQKREFQTRLSTCIERGVDCETCMELFKQMEETK